MAGRIGKVEVAQDGSSYGFIIYDERNHACAYMGYSTWHQADIAARHVQGLLATVLVFEKR